MRTASKCGKNKHTQLETRNKERNESRWWEALPAPLHPFSNLCLRVLDSAVPSGMTWTPSASSCHSWVMTPSTAKMIQDRGWLPRLYASWEMPAFFDPPFSGLVRHSFLDGLQHCVEETNVWASSLICLERLLTSSSHVLPASCKN